MKCQFLGKVFRTICLGATGALFLRGGLKYFKDESSTQIEYRTYQDTERDIYPTITLCIWNNGFEQQLGLYDRKVLNETYKINDPLEYIHFLDGYIWQDEMIGVNYDDVTLNIEDRVEHIQVTNDRMQKLYGWSPKDKNSDEDTNSSFFFSNITQVFPFYTSYRHAWGKCFSLDLTVEKMPNIQGHLISEIMIKFKDIRIPGVNLQYVISYPGQILQGFPIDMEFAWSQRITTGYFKAKWFLIDSIEIFRKRNTDRNPCNKNWKGYDDAVFRDIIKKAKCRPPHWNISSNYPICNSKEKTKNVSIPGSSGKIAAASFLKSFLQPCDWLQAATLTTFAEQRGISLGGLIPTGGGKSADVVFQFKNDRYKEIKDTRNFDIESLIGNVGGYIGLFLGFAIWQLPAAVEFLDRKLQLLLGGELCH